MNAPTGIVDIRGKQYLTVAKRVDDFRGKYPEHGLTTEIVLRDDDCVVMQARIADTSGRILATGHSEEYRKSSQINRTSALENAETSAIGRALAAFGFGGTEFASANEVQNAIHQQGEHSQDGAVSPPALPEQLATQIIALAGQVGKNELGLILNAYSVGDIRDLAEKQAQAVIKRLNEKLAEKKEKVDA